MSAKSEEEHSSLLTGTNLDDRIGFIRKTYAILSVMLAFSFTWVAIF